MGFEPALSEFGDIFYEIGEHIQDSCQAEVARCNMFVLVVGNNYGSLYYRDKGVSETPDSVTLREFRKALNVGIPKFIFVNRFVQHDFRNYQRILAKKCTEHFRRTDVSDAEVAETKDKIKRQFDEAYHFPQEAYRYIFYFLDIIDSLKTNNAVMAFEAFEDIQKQLRKQWAGLVYESLTRKFHKVPPRSSRWRPWPIFCSTGWR